MLVFKQLFTFLKRTVPLALLLRVDPIVRSTFWWETPKPTHDTCLQTLPTLKPGALSVGMLVHAMQLHS